MRIRSTYICEICNSEYNTEAKALACEALGQPQLPDWLSNYKGCTIAMFADSGVVEVGYWPTKFEVVLHSKTGHVLRHVATDAMFEEFHPLESGHFLYDVGTDRYANEMEDWLDWCLTYGIEPLPEKSIWFLGLSEDAQADVVGVLARAKFLKQRA